MRVCAADESDGECGSDGSGNGGGSLFALARAFLRRAASRRLPIRTSSLRRSTVPEKLILGQRAAQVDCGETKYLSVTRRA